MNNVKKTLQGKGNTNEALKGGRLRRPTQKHASGLLIANRSPASASQKGGKTGVIGWRGQFERGGTALSRFCRKKNSSGVQYEILEGVHNRRAYPTERECTRPSGACSLFKKELGGKSEKKLRKGEPGGER